MKIVFFGTSDFAARILTFLLENSYQIAAVVTRPDRPQGRSLRLMPPPVKETALALRPDLPIYQPEKASTKEFEAILASHEADLFLVVAFGEIIKQNLLDLPKITCMNIHTSLLPKYRGAAPMQRCLMDGHTETGVTFIEMVLQMDAGDIIACSRVDMPSNMNCGELDASLMQATLLLLPQVLKDFSGFYAQKKPQDPSQVTFAPKITPEETEIRWNQSAWQIHNKIRALAPYPGAWCKVKIGNEEKRLKIKASLYLEALSGVPGMVLDRQKEWIVACQSGALKLMDVQLEGKRMMSAEEFLKGLQQPVEFL